MTINILTSMHIWFKIKRYVFLALLIFPFVISDDFLNVTHLNNPQRLVLQAIQGKHFAVERLVLSRKRSESLYWRAVSARKLKYPLVKEYVRNLQSDGHIYASHWILFSWMRQSIQFGRTVSTTELNDIAKSFSQSPKILHYWLTIYPDLFDGRLWKAYFREIASLTEIAQTTWLPTYYKNELLHEISFLTVPPRGVNSESCVVFVLPVVQTWHGLTKLRAFYALMKQKRQKPIGGLCFQQAVLEPLGELCVQHKGINIHCELSAFSHLKNQQSSTSQLLILADSGLSNTQLGVSYINSQEPVKTVLHEFLHLFNFIDEYELERSVKTRYCRINALQILGSNAVGVVNEQSLANVRQKLIEIRNNGFPIGRWSTFLHHLAPVNTCKNEMVSVFRIADTENPHSTLMQYADGVIPDIYWRKLEEEILLRRGLLNHYSQAMAEEAYGYTNDWRAISRNNNGASNYFAADSLLASGKEQQAEVLLKASSEKGYSLASMLLAVQLLKHDENNRSQALYLVEQAVLSGEYVAIELYISLLKEVGKVQQAKLWHELLLEANTSSE